MELNFWDFGHEGIDCRADLLFPFLEGLVGDWCAHSFKVNSKIFSAGLESEGGFLTWSFDNWKFSVSHANEMEMRIVQITVIEAM